MNEDDDDKDRFSEDERITANLRLRSVSPASRTVIGLFALIPSQWRGPVAVFSGAVLGYLAAHALPDLIQWLIKAK